MMKNKLHIIPLALIVLLIVTATGCTSSFVTIEQFIALKSQVNTLSSELNSTRQQLLDTQQQLASTKQQLASVQQSLSQAQEQLQNQSRYVTSSQPVYRSNVVYQTYPYGYWPYPY